MIPDVIRKDDEVNWEKDVLSKSKLRLYKKLKIYKCTDNYVTINLAPSERSFIAQMRFGILPLAIETGRFSRTPVENRTCSFCTNCTEDELHFLFVCPHYQRERSLFFQDFQELISPNKILTLENPCNHAPRQLAKFIKICFQSRKRSIYVTGWSTLSLFIHLQSTFVNVTHRPTGPGISSFFPVIHYFSVMMCVTKINVSFIHSLFKITCSYYM